MIYEVIVDISNREVDKVFDYLGEDFFCIGQRVLVPFANRDIEGFIVGKKENTDVDESKLKSIIFPLDDYVALTPQMLELAAFMKEKYHLRLIDILRLFLPAQMRGGRVKEIYKKQVEIDGRYDANALLQLIKPAAKAQREIVVKIEKEGKCDCADIKQASALSALIGKGYLKVSFAPKRRTPYKGLEGDCPLHEFIPQQQKAYDTITSDLTGKYLLFGVTGSGKTEVYMRVIESVLKLGKRAVMLVPEISLTPSLMKLFRSRFGEKAALLHSGLSAGERFDEWQRLKRGEAVIAVGARSAVFAPLENIGAIIIDEQHDASYKSENNPRYDTLDVADFRRRQNNCALILGSATPSLDVFYKSQRGEYKLVEMNERINAMPLPAVEIVDMGLEVRSGNKGVFSSLLKKELDECLAKGNQAMLFINRRGYSSFVMCNKCGYVAKCKDCDIALTYHQEDNQLKCHYCKNKYKMLSNCPVCGNTSLRQGKTGTEQVVKLLKSLYPDVKTLRMDSDTTSTKESHAKILDAFARQQAQILVGTQMIAKGHDFPKVTLVGILEGDQGLYRSDYLSAERTYQLLTQVAGRSGRAEQSGKVVLQTYTPRHYCLQLSKTQDYISFYKKEINLREATNFPPFCEVVRILYQSEDSAKCVSDLNKHYEEITLLKSKREKDFIFLQRMRCPLQRIEKKFRYQILMRLESGNADDTLKEIYKIIDIHDKEVSVFCERDPQNLS